MTHHHQWLITYGTSSSMAHNADGGSSLLAQHLWHFVINGASPSLMGLPLLDVYIIDVTSSAMVLHHRWLIIFGTSSSMANHADGGFSYLAQHLWHIIINGASSALMGASSLMSTSLMTLYHQWCFIINGSSSMALYHRWLIICGTLSSMAHHM